MSEPLEMNVDFETSDTEMNMETDMNCNIKVPLPIASATRLGGIKVGENLSIAADGTLSADASAVVVDNTLTIAGAAADAKKTGYEIASLKEDYAQILDSAYVTDTASGAIASFPDGADNVPVKSLKVNIEPIQKGSGDPSPDNVRPISGHTQAKVTRAGKNLVDVRYPSMTKDGITYTNNDDGSFVLNGTATAVVTIRIDQNADSGSGSGNSKSYSAGTYTFSGGSTKFSFLLMQFVSWNQYFSSNSSTSKTETITDATDAFMYISIPNGASFSNETFKLMFEKGSTATDYKVYDAQTVTIDLNGTRYGGTLDVTTGVLTVDRGMLDLGSLTWIYNTANTAFFAYTNDVPNFSAPAIENDGICSIYAVKRMESIEAFRNHDKVLYISPSKWTNTNKTIVIRDTIYTDEAAFKTSISGQTVVYPLETPFTVQLTANEISTLLGQNNIWADTGDTEVTYRADAKLYIEKLTAPT